MDMSPWPDRDGWSRSLVVVWCPRSYGWWTMEPGKYRALTFVLLGFFGFRVVLARRQVAVG